MPALSMHVIPFSACSPHELQKVRTRVLVIFRLRARVGLRLEPSSDKVDVFGRTMKCEMCHKAEAETVVHKIVADERRELFVCQDCAKKADRRSSPHESHPPTPQAVSDGIPAVPLMGLILDAAFEIVGRSLNLKEPACPVCGILREEYRKRSRLGCPACYEAFSKELEGAILDLHRATQHTGKVPGSSDLGDHPA